MQKPKLIVASLELNGVYWAACVSKQDDGRLTDIKVIPLTVCWQRPEVKIVVFGCGSRDDQVIVFASKNPINEYGLRTYTLRHHTIM